MLITEPATRAAFLTSTAGIVRTWNDGCESLFGLTAEQILGKPMSTLLSGSAQGEVDAWWGTLPRNSTIFSVDIQGAGNTVCSAVLTLAPQQDHDDLSLLWVAAFAAEMASNASESERVGRTPLSAIAKLFAGTFYVINRERHFVLWNQNLEVVTEMTPEELAAVDVLDMFNMPQRRAVEENIRKVFEQGAEVELEADYVSKGGRERPYLLCGTGIDCNGTLYLFGMGVDISARREQEKLLRLRERALHAANNGIVITRYEGRENPIEYMNPAFERITGYPLAEVQGRDPRFMAAPGLDANERAVVRKALSERRAVNVVFRNMRKDGELFWNDLSITPVLDEKGKLTHFIGVIVDVTAAKQRTASLEHEVNHDALTGLANRNLLWDRLEHAIHFAQRHKSLVATVLIDLNNFKAINDTFGHAAGDVVLKVVASRLKAGVRDCDTVARLSGDEFVLILDNQPSLRYTLRRVESLRQEFSIPVSFNDQEIPVGASIGVSIYPHDGRTAHDLVRAADVAMYSAKATGKSDVHFFSADMSSTAEAKQRLESDMRGAIDRDEFFLVYQVRACVHTGKITGLEALLRWRHPEQGVVLPISFLREAEESGVIVQIGNRVLDLACAFIQTIRQRGHTGLPVAVNVSHKEYQRQDFVADIAERLVRYGIPSDCLEIDLHEQDLIRYPELGRQVAGQMGELGVPLSVDEFGEGMFDLPFLQQLSVRNLKIAKAAVHAISMDERPGPLAKTLIDIGHNMGMNVIGAAVETRLQMEFLKSHGCAEILGNFFSAPLTADAILQLLENSTAGKAPVTVDPV
jgi:diguanylate cyclase (GGDEF)-like protein/PAS domain S-box-containing protein